MYNIGNQVFVERYQAV